MDPDHTLKLGRASNGQILSVFQRTAAWCLKHCVKIFWVNTYVSHPRRNGPLESTIQIRIRPGHKFWIWLDPDPQHCREPRFSNLFGLKTSGFQTTNEPLTASSNMSKHGMHFSMKSSILMHPYSMDVHCSNLLYWLNSSISISFDRTSRLKSNF